MPSPKHISLSPYATNFVFPQGTNVQKIIDQKTRKRRLEAAEALVELSRTHSRDTTSYKNGNKKTTKKRRKRKKPRKKRGGKNKRTKKI